VLGATPLVAVLGAVTDPHADASAYLRELGRLGLAVVFLDAALEPVDPRASVTARRNPVTDPLELATSDIIALQRYWKSYRKRFPEQPLRIGIELARSGIVEVRCFTHDARRSFLDLVHSALMLAPTIVDDTGCAYWFTTTPADASTHAPDILDPSGFVIRRAGVTIIPPTEGVVLAGREWDAPAWLTRRIGTPRVSV
jgi:hypothetical protein